MSHFCTKKASKVAAALAIAGVSGLSLLPLNASAAQIPESVTPEYFEVTAGGGGATVHDCWGNNPANCKEIKDNMGFPLSVSFRTMTLGVKLKDGQTVVLKDPNGGIVETGSTEEQLANNQYQYKFVGNLEDYEGDYEFTISDGTDSKTYALHTLQANGYGETHSDDDVHFNFQNKAGDIWQEEFVYGEGLSYQVKRPHGYDLVQFEEIKGCSGANLRRCSTTDAVPTADNIEQYQYSVKLGDKGYVALDADGPSDTYDISGVPAIYVTYVGGGIAVFQNQIYILGEYPYALVDFTDGTTTEQKQIDFVTDTKIADYSTEELDFTPNKATCATGTGEVELKANEVSTLTCVDGDNEYVINIFNNNTKGGSDSESESESDSKSEGEKNPETLDKNYGIISIVAGVAVSALGVFAAASRKFFRR